MPVPLNAFVDVVRVWFTERLGYLVNDSVPVKPSRLGRKAPTPSDIDLICKHPTEKDTDVSFESGVSFGLSPNLLVECKGWFDYSKPEFAKHLYANINLIKKYDKNFLPQSLSKKDQDHLFFFRQEVFEKGLQTFGSENFQRVVVGPFLVPPKNAEYPLSKLIAEYKKQDIIVIEIRDILGDLFRFIQNAKRLKKEGDSSAADKLRKTYALEMLHLVNTYMEPKLREAINN